MYTKNYKDELYLPYSQNDMNTFEDVDLPGTFDCAKVLVSKEKISQKGNKKINNKLLKFNLSNLCSELSASLISSELGSSVNKIKSAAPEP